MNDNLLQTEPMAGGEPRFGMLGTIREYALERLAERGDIEAVRRRHAGYYVVLAEEAEPGASRARNSCVRSNFSMQRSPTFARR